MFSRFLGCYNVLAVICVFVTSKLRIKLWLFLFIWRSFMQDFMEIATHRRQFLFFLAILLKINVWYWMYMCHFILKYHAHNGELLYKLNTILRGEVFNNLFTAFCTTFIVFVRQWIYGSIIHPPDDHVVAGVIVLLRKVTFIYCLTLIIWLIGYVC